MNCNDLIFSQAFSVVFDKAIDRAEPAEEVKARVLNLIDCITYSVFVYTTRGLFERDKLTFTSQLAFQVWAIYFLQMFDFTAVLVPTSQLNFTTM